MQRREQFTLIYAALLSNSNCGGRSPDVVIHDAATHLRAIIEFERRVETEPEFRMLWFGIDENSLRAAVEARERNVPGRDPLLDPEPPNLT